MSDQASRGVTPGQHPTRPCISKYIRQRVPARGIIRGTVRVGMFTNMALGVFCDAGRRRFRTVAFGGSLGLRSAMKSGRLLFGLYAVLCVAAAGGCSILPHDGP